MNANYKMTLTALRAVALSALAMMLSVIAAPSCKPFHP
jgi:hypothetical protein